MLGSAVLVAVIIVVAAIVMVQKSSDKKQTQENLRMLAQNQIQTETARCAQESNPEACLTRAVSQIAANTDVSVCDAFEQGGQKDSCLWAVAKQEQDLRVCAMFSDSESAEQCSDSVIFAKATVSGDIGACKEIKDEFVRINCQASIEQPILESGACAGTDVSQERCDAYAILLQARKASDESVCEQITLEDIRSTCYDVVDTDKDKDGLSSVREEHYGLSDDNPDFDSDGLRDGVEVDRFKTDPKNPDTDGDGFKDGDEVANGYNPSGAEKL